jgi:hypothetical protein
MEESFETQLKTTPGKPPRGATVRESPDLSDSRDRDRVLLESRRIWSAEEGVLGWGFGE